MYIKILETRVPEMVLLVRVLASQPDNLTSVPGIQVTEWKIDSHELFTDFHICTDMNTYDKSVSSEQMYGRKNTGDIVMWTVAEMCAV